MARDLTVDFQTELAAGLIYPVLFFYADLNSITLRLTTALNNLSWDSQTWLGNGWLYGVSPVPETTNIAAVGASVSLSGVPSELISAALQNSL